MQMSHIVKKLLGEKETVLKSFSLSEKYLFLKLISSLFGSLMILSILYLSFYFSKEYWSGFFELDAAKQTEIVNTIFLLMLGSFLFIIIPFQIFIHRFYLKISHEYIFTNKRIIVKNGWISTNAVSVHYNRITDISIKQGIIDRILGIGAISISTAGTDGHLISLKHIPNPYNLKKDLYDLKEEYLKNMYIKQNITFEENAGD